MEMILKMLEHREGDKLDSFIMGLEWLARAFPPCQDQSFRHYMDGVAASSAPMFEACLGKVFGKILANLLRVLKSGILSKAQSLHAVNALSWSYSKRDLTTEVPELGLLQTIYSNMEPLDHI